MDLCQQSNVLAFEYAVQVCHSFSSKNKKGCYFLGTFLADARRMLFFKVEQVFQPAGDIWLMKNTDAQCTMLDEKKRLKDRENFLC